MPRIYPTTQVIFILPVKRDNFPETRGLRHSFAVHLLRKGTSLKTIGDLLGHRSAEATCMYLRLATEDLRDVPLLIPHNRSVIDTEVCR